jgi:hypothetical protein
LKNERGLSLTGPQQRFFLVTILNLTLIPLFISITNKSAARAGGYMSTMNEKVYAKPAPAGILNSKTLAEENLKGFRLRNLQKESDLPLRVNQPQRIELPIYFNTPKRKEDIISKKRLDNK